MLGAAERDSERGCLVAERAQSIAVQIVLYRSADHLPRLLRALEHVETAGADVVVRMINNSPGDRSAAILAEYGGPLTIDYVESSDGNIGFGRGQNLLAERSRDADLLLLLNPDTIPFHDVLVRLVDAARNSSRAGLFEAAQFPVEHQKAYDTRSGDTNWCCATCLLVRADLFRELGGFDDHIFLYCEDVDLSWRVWSAGQACRYVPAAKCVHVSQEEDMDKDRAPEVHHMHLGDLYLRRKWFDRAAEDDHLRHLRVWVGSIETQKLVSELDLMSPPPPRPSRPPQAVLMPDQINYAPVRW